MLFSDDRDKTACFKFAPKAAPALAVSRGFLRLQLQPILAILAGILILVKPGLLNYIVAVCLILFFRYSGLDPAVTAKGAGEVDSGAGALPIAPLLRARNIAADGRKPAGFHDRWEPSRGWGESVSK